MITSLALAVALLGAPAAVAEPPVYEVAQCAKFEPGSAIEWPDGVPGALIEVKRLMNGTIAACSKFYPDAPIIVLRVVDDGTDAILLFDGDPDLDLGDVLTGLGAPPEDYAAVGLEPPRAVETPGAEQPPVPAPLTPETPASPLPFLLGTAVAGGLVTGAVVVIWALRRNRVAAAGEEGVDA